MNHRFLFRFVVIITVFSMLLGAVDAPPQKAWAAPAGKALQFNGSSQYVTLGSSAGMSTGLGVQVFTIETWFKKTGTGATTTTGTGGITAVPLVTKGRGEAENSNVDMNYFFGIDSTGVLAADFEECALSMGAPCTAAGNGGQNYPAKAATVILNNTWYHAAVTYDGQTWRFYLNGVPDGTTTLTAARYPRWDSIQHAGLGTAMTSTGAAGGFFQGIIDEARIWNVVRTQAEIQADMYNELTSGTGLIGRWGLNEGSGTGAANSILNRPNGTLTNSPTWVDGFPKPPSAPADLTATGAESRIDLSWSVSTSPSISGYNIYRDTISGFTPGLPLNSSLVTGTTYSDYTGVVGTTYYYVVKAVDTYDLVSLKSNEASAAPLADSTPPAAPTGLTATGIEGAVNLVWTAPGDIDVAGYNIYRDTGSGFIPGTPINVSLVTGTAYSDQAGVVGTTYYYVVKAVDTSGNASAISNEASAASSPNSTPPAAPTGLTPTVGLAQFTLSWTANNETDLVGYNVYRATNPGVPLTSPINGETLVGSPVYIDTSVLKDTTYYYVVTAVDTGSNQSGASNEVTARLAGALQFDGTDDYVTFGPATGLNTHQFTLETWFYWTGGGVTASTGTGGITAIPLVSKGRGESETTGLNVNYFLGISGGKLAADFEAYSGGANYPVTGATTVTTNTWHHAAVTYNGSCWQLYLDGNADTNGASCPGVEPDYSSTQHAGLGTALTSGGVAQGFFAGNLDEVRVWNYARSLNDIRATINSELNSGIGLIGRWSMNEGTGTTISSSVGSFPGTLTNGPVWVTPGAPFTAIPDTNPPAVPTGLLATPGNTMVALNWTANNEADLAGYKIYRSTTPGVPTTIPIASVYKPAINFNDSGLTNGQPFYYVITAIDRNGFESGPSNEVNATPIGAPPAAPTGLTASSTIYSIVSLGWSDNSADETGFEVERSSTGNGGPFSLLATTAAGVVAYQDKGLTGSTEFCYRVRAINSYGSSGYTDLSCVTTPAEGAFGLQFDGTNDYVTFGNPPELGMQNFTVETWFKRTGTGVAVSSGSNGVTAVPLVTKGSPQADGSNVDENYILGIRSSDNVLAADFEIYAACAGRPAGDNNPIVGVTPIANDTWYHAAFTYDGASLKLYLNGVLEASLASTCLPRYDSIQHAGLGTYLTSAGAASGFFNGTLDEVRIWNYARTQAEIRSAINSEVSSGTGLVTRWGLNEGTGTAIYGPLGVTPGTLINGPAWAAGGAPFNITFDTQPPAAPTNLMASPAPGAVLLEWTANTEPDLAGYKIYRNTGSPVTIGTPINATVSISPAFTDETVTAGTTYFYAVTAVDINGNESALSNEVNAVPLPPPPAEALKLGSSNAYVPLGDNADLVTFTLETWLRRDGAGTATSTGSGGETLIPLITNGTAEAETAAADINYFFGIRGSDGVLCADFEEAQTGTSPGLNHPACGVTALSNGTWYHVSATYDGTTWRLYLNGNLEKTLAVGQPVNTANTSQLAFGTSLTTANSPLGYFNGTLDEVRIWNYARSQAQIASTINQKIETATGLVGRWGLDEAVGNTVHDSTGNVTSSAISGTGYSWVPGSPFNVTVNLPPEMPALVAPAHGATNVPMNTNLSVNVTDPEGGLLDVTFYGRLQQAAAGPDFTIVVIPDTQYYAASYPSIFNAQTQWVADNKANDNIVYVASLGDNVDTVGITTQWDSADAAYDILDTASMAYGLAVGNHDGGPSNTTNFNSYFGSARFTGKPYYGGHYGSDNDNHYDLFTASGIKFIVIYIEYDDSMTSTDNPVLQWANGLLASYSDRRAIVISHNMLQGGTSTSFSTQGQTIYNALKGNPNLFLMLGGHLDVASRRTDVFNGNTVYTLRSDYQFVDNNQSGYLRIMRFSPADDMIYVRTYSPTQNKDYDKSDAAQNNFNLPFTMDGIGFEVIGTAYSVTSGQNASISWSSLNPNEQYEWFAIASDGTHQTSSGTWSFTTAGAAQALTVSKTGSGSGTVTSEPAGIDCGATCSSVFPNNTSVTLTASPALGSSFIGWSGAGCTGMGTCVISMDGTKDVTATFTSITYVSNLQPSWTASEGGGVFSAYVGPPDYGYVSPGATALYQGREAGIIMAGLAPDPVDGHYWDEGLFGFKPNITIDAFAAGSLTYDVVNQYGENPVWMTIEIDTGIVDDRNDNTTYQFVPVTNPTGWHTVDGAAGLWQKWNDNNGNVTGNPLIPLSEVATTHSGLNVVRAYLRLGMGDSYHGIAGLGTVAWVDKVTLAGAAYDFVSKWYVAPTGLDTNLGTATSPFLTIQKAIDAASAGDTIHVAAGTYPERLVVSKPLTLSGAGVGLSVIDATSFGTPGHVVDIQTLAGNTKIEGFDILTGDYSNGIHSAGGTDATGKIEILNNHIISTNFGDDQYGIIAGYGDVRKLIISGNEISNTYSNSILVELQMGETDISGNTLNGAFPSIFFMTYDGNNVTALQRLNGNLIDMSTADAATSVAGIGVNPSTYYVEAARRTGKYVNFEISGNTITGLNDVSFKGISIGENSVDGTSGGFGILKIFGNTVSGTNGKGIQLFGHITSAEIYDNVLTGLFQGIKGFTYESTFYPEGNTIYHNQVTGAADRLAQWEGAGTFNVEANWWGSSMGPDPARMSLNVDYSPWCLDAACTRLSIELLTPSGLLSSWDNRFSWTGVSGATWYYLDVQTAAGAQVLLEWFMAGETGCDGDLSCAVSPAGLATLANGDYRWRIRDWGAYGAGPWSGYQTFTLNAACYALTTTVAGGSGTVSASPAPSCDGKYTAGSVVFLTAQPDNGFSFDGWSGDAIGMANPVTVTMNADRSVTANLRGITPLTPSGLLSSWDNHFSWTGVSGATWYYLDVQTATGAQVLLEWFMAGETGCDGDLSCAISPAGLATLANGDYRWRIRDWGAYGAGPWSGYQTFTLNAACYTLTTTVAGGSGTISASPTPNCDGKYTAGSVVHLTAQPDNGFLFDGWSGDAIGMANPVTVVMGSDMTVIANLNAVSPAGTLTSWDNTFSWTGVSGATWYYLDVQTVEGAQVLLQWYTAEQASCSADKSCALSIGELSTLANGTYRWRFLDWGDYGAGAWTPFISFTLNR